MRWNVEEIENVTLNFSHTLMPLCVEMGKYCLRPPKIKLNSNSILKSKEIKLFLYFWFIHINVHSFIKDVTIDLFYFYIELTLRFVPMSQCCTNVNIKLGIFTFFMFIMYTKLKRTPLRHWRLYIQTIAQPEYKFPNKFKSEITVQKL